MADFGYSSSRESHSIYLKDWLAPGGKLRRFRSGLPTGLLPPPVSSFTEHPRRSRQRGRSLTSYAGAARFQGRWKWVHTHCPNSKSPSWHCWELYLSSFQSWESKHWKGGFPDRNYQFWIKTCTIHEWMSPFGVFLQWTLNGPQHSMSSGPPEQALCAHWVSTGEGAFRFAKFTTIVIFLHFSGAP